MDKSNNKKRNRRTICMYFKAYSIKCTSFCVQAHPLSLFNGPYAQHLPTYTSKNMFAAGYYQLLCVTLYPQKDLYLE